MCQTPREQLSELLDGELDPGALDSVLDELDHNLETRAAWARYHLIGDVLRGETIDCRTWEVADRVRAYLACAAPSATRRIVPRWRRAAWEMALAASLAAVAILAGSSMFRSDFTANITAQALPVATLYQDHAVMRWSQSPPELEARLTNFLLNHQASAPAAGIRGMVPYATWAHYEPER